MKRVCIAVFLSLAVLPWAAACDRRFEKDATALTRRFEKKLKGELMAAVKGGMPSAIRVCQERAPAIAAGLSTDKLLVRRIGTKLRNLNNAPDSHDQQALTKLSADAPILKTRDPKRYYRAIVMKPLCLGCHGSPEQLAPEVKSVLAELYPEDRAVGYKAGDLRGAFVVQAKPGS